MMLKTSCALAAPRSQEARPPAPQQRQSAAAAAGAHNKHDCVGEFAHNGGAQGRQMGYLGECDHQGGHCTYQGTGSMPSFRLLLQP